jgi:hypothetical protein
MSLIDPAIVRDSLRSLWRKAWLRWITYYAVCFLALSAYLSKDWFVERVAQRRSKDLYRCETETRESPDRPADLMSCLMRLGWKTRTAAYEVKQWQIRQPQ